MVGCAALLCIDCLLVVIEARAASNGEKRIWTTGDSFKEVVDMFWADEVVWINKYKIFSSNML